MRLDREAVSAPGTVRRSFSTQLDPVDAFGLSNELLARRGFKLDEGQPGKFQRWCRGTPSDSKRTPVDKLPQTIRLEFDHGRISATGTAHGGTRQSQADMLMTAYIQAIESLLARREPVEQVSSNLDISERAAKKAVSGGGSSKRTLIAATVAILGGVAAVAVWWSAAAPASGSKPTARAKSKNHTPPIVTVRRAGELPPQSAVKPD